VGGGITFDVSLDEAIHDRSIVTDTGWKIILGRGLEILQYVTATRSTSRADSRSFVRSKHWV